MVEFNYCPQCATSKIGRFCAGCGLNLEELEAVFASMVNPPLSAEQGPDVSETKVPTGDVATSGLVYGDSFDPDTDCSNCGSPGSKTDCPLCDAG